jgi:hypothetical protein
LTSLAGLLLTSLELVGSAARLERRLSLVEVDAMPIILRYVGAIVLLCRQGSSVDS